MYTFQAGFTVAVEMRRMTNATNRTVKLHVILTGYWVIDTGDLSMHMQGMRPQ